MSGTMASRLEWVRRRRFVGRRTELELFGELLKSEQPETGVLYVHGPGGVGKSALLRAMADAAAEAGAEPVRVDGRTTEPSPKAFREALAGPRGRLVLLIDGYEDFRALDSWIRDRLIPGLPVDSIVVIAGRDTPSRDWYDDPGWREVMRALLLANLDEHEVVEYARIEGLSGEIGTWLSETTHGHPLALVLLIDVLRQSPGTRPDLADLPDVVGRLVECFLAEAPTDRHRDALQVCALARSTTEPLLHAALEGSVTDLLTWLRGLSFVEHDRFGVYPHDLVRQVICADLRWRNRPYFAELHRKVRDHLIQQVFDTRGREQHRLVSDVHFLVRSNPVLHGYWDWDRMGEAYYEPARADDHQPIVEMTREHEGPEAARLAAFWLRHPAAVVTAFRGDHGLIGYSLVLRLEQLTQADASVDPGAEAAWAHLRSHGPAEATLARFFMDRERYQRPSASLNAAIALHNQRLFSVQQRGFEFIGSYQDGDRMAALLTHGGYVRLPDYHVGPVAYALFVRDWRGRSLKSWLELTGQRDIGMPDRHGGDLTLPEFAAATREALRDLHRPDRLASSPLLHYGLAVDADGLAAVLRNAVHDLGAEPRGERHMRVLERTFLRSAQTQEKAAEALGLPFSTYRRHLTRGLERITDRLWHQATEPH